MLNIIIVSLSLFNLSSMLLTIIIFYFMWT